MKDKVQGMFAGAGKRKRDGIDEIVVLWMEDVGARRRASATPVRLEGAEGVGGAVGRSMGRSPRAWTGVEGSSRR